MNQLAKRLAADGFSFMQGGETRVLLVHGLGAHTLSWEPSAAGLAERLHATVTAVDLPGFGHTPLGGRSASLEGSGELLDRFLREVAGSPVVLVGSSMRKKGQP